MDEPAHVVVIGDGPVGQTTALLLARWGVACTVLDQRAHREPAGSRALCQQGDVLDIWESVGAGAQIAREGVTWNTARTYYRGSELFSVTLPAQVRGVFPPFVNLSQNRTEDILDEAVAAHPSIDVRWGHRVLDLTQDDDGVTVVCGPGADGSPERLRCDHVVVCSGAHSDGLHGLLGVSFDGRSFDDRFLIADVRAELPDRTHERRFHFDPPFNPGRQVLVHPCPDSVYRIDWQVPAEFDLDAERASGALDARVRAVIGDVGHEVLATSVYRFSSRQVDRMQQGRVLLAGDAAHLMSPFGARGLNSGVADAENAAWKLAFVLRGWAPPALLASYHDERHAAGSENLAVTTATMDFLVPPDERRAAYRRDVLARAVHDPAARSLIDSGRLAEPFWYVDSPLTTADPARPFAGRPPRGQLPPAQPGVLVPDVPLTGPDGRRTRLRTLARDGFLLLVVGDHQDEAAVRAAVADVPGPVRALGLPAWDRDGTTTDALGARPGEVWILRPDAHVAAVVPPTRREQLPAALARARGASPPR